MIPHGKQDIDYTLHRPKLTSTWMAMGIMTDGRSYDLPPPPLVYAKLQ